MAPPFLASVVDGGEWSASRPGLFTSGERAPGTHYIGGWVGPRAGLETASSRIPAGQLVVLRYTNSGTFLNNSRCKITVSCPIF
jgi:hypothetical protein